jgi:hypothetical protein
MSGCRCEGQTMSHISQEDVGNCYTHNISNKIFEIEFLLIKTDVTE